MSGSSDISDDYIGSTSDEGEEEEKERGSDDEVREGVQALPPHWRRRFFRHKPRAHNRNPPALSADQWAALVEAYSNTIDDARADSTWNVLATVLRQFCAFDEVQAANLPQYNALPLDDRMVMWHLNKIIKKEISGSTPYKYCKILIQLYRRMTGGSFSPILSDYKKALRRKGLHIPNGARPIALTELKLAIDRSRDRAERMQLLAMWLLCSRCDDVNRLRRQDIEVEPEGARRVYRVTWRAGTKKGALPLVDFLIPPREHEDEWEAYLESVAVDQHPFALKAARITEVLRRVLHRVSSHSIKKGALAMLVMRGVPLHRVANKAKHETVAQLREYVGERLYAMAQGAMEIAEDIEAEW
jgi:hypothetical protein